MKISVLTVQTSKATWIEQVALEYEKKITTLVPFDRILVKPKDAARDDRNWKRQQDSLALLDKISERDFVIVCDEKGREFDSRQFSSQLVRGIESGKTRVVIVIGGPFGVSDELRDRAQLVWKLSSMTLSHWIAQVVVFEQLYRALSIWKNLPYHND